MADATEFYTLAGATRLWAGTTVEWKGGVGNWEDLAMWVGTLPSRTTGVLAEDGLHIGVYNHLNLEKEPPPSASELIFELDAEAVTSYGSQGKTVDYALFSDSAIKIAANDQQWYVPISRGRRGIRIFTPDKEPDGFRLHRADLQAIAARRIPTLSDAGPDSRESSHQPCASPQRLNQTLVEA